MPWKDITPQVKVTVKNDNGFISHWFNLRGYKNVNDCPNGIAPKGHEFVSSEYGNEQYLIDSKTKERIVSEDKTETAIAGLMDFTVQTGIPEGTEFESLKELFAAVADKQLAVMVREGENSNEVHYFTKASRVKVSDEVTA